MIPVIWNLFRVYAPYVTLPFAAVVGAIGYNVEKSISRRYTPSEGSVVDKRIERRVEEMMEHPVEETASLLKDPNLIRNVFVTNTSPSLPKPVP